MKKKRFVFLSDIFYKSYPCSQYPEIEQKQLRPYIQVLTQINGIQYAIPLRSNIKHPHVLWTDKKNRCGLDFSKAVVILDNSYIDYSKSPHIRKIEFDALRGKDFRIKQLMIKYINDYKNAKNNLNDDINRTLYEKSTLKYFEEFIFKNIGELIVRKMKPDDIQAVYIIEKQSFSNPWSEDSFEYAINCDSDHCIVAEFNGQVVGYALLRCSFEVADLMNIAVDPSHRNKGIGSRLMDNLIESGNSQGITDIFLEVRTGNTPAIVLYEKKGFKQESVRKDYYSNPTEDALIMCRRCKDIG